MFKKKYSTFRGKNALIISDFGKCSLKDTFECGQAFRYECTADEDGYLEYITVVGDRLISVGQASPGELIFYEVDEESEELIEKYFTLSVDYAEIKAEITEKSDSDWLHNAANEAKGIVILAQEPWETLFSFIISQNNNIPRIRKIIRTISAEYGENLAVKNGLTSCPLGKTDCPGSDICKDCGVCYSFPTADAILTRPEGLLRAHPGFRYKYLIDAAERVSSGEVDLAKIEAEGSYEYTLTQLKKIKGVGDKVASCVALFGFGNYEAFPIDVWMKRAIDKYFDGNLDPKSLGKYAGIAQQYIFHYIRNLEKKAEI